MIWSETPPTKAGTYLVYCGYGAADTVTLDDDLRLWIGGHPFHVSDLTGYLFGPPIPTPEVCAEIAKGGGIRDLVEDYADAVADVAREVERGLMLVEIPKSHDSEGATLAAIKRRDTLREQIDAAFGGDGK